MCLVIEARRFSARYYGAPIYLVGSAVTSDDPRDIDLVAIVPKALFYASYGAASAEEGVELFRVATACLDVPKPWQRWARDCARQSTDLTMTLRRAVDFKVQSDRDAVTISDAPRVLLARLLVVAPLRRPGRRLPSHACGASWRRCSPIAPREVDGAPARARGRPPMGGTPAPAGGASLRPRLLGASTPSARAGRRGPRAPAAAAEVVPRDAPVRALTSPVLESARTPRRGRRRARPQPYPTPRGGARARRVGGIRHAGGATSRGRRSPPMGAVHARGGVCTPSMHRASKRRPHDAHARAHGRRRTTAAPRVWRHSGGCRRASPAGAAARAPDHLSSADRCAEAPSAQRGTATP